METIKPLVNRVTAQNVLLTLDLEDYLPKEGELVFIDLKNYLFKELILKEAEFREAVKQTDWSVYKDKYVSLYCSNDALVPMWAYMILCSSLSPYTKEVAFCKPEEAPDVFLYRNLCRIDMEQFRDKRVVVKGCGEKRIPEAAYVLITQQLSAVARVLMFGEPCSTVPVWKKTN